MPKTPTKNAMIKLKNIDKKDDDGPKMESRKYFRTYEVEFKK